MAKRRPNIVPHLSTTSGDKIPESLQARRKGIVPSQTTLSVQDVKDYSTPEGAAMANEEMRRLRLGLDNLRQQVPDASAQDPNAKPRVVVTTPEDRDKDKDKDPPPASSTEWALTVLHNKRIIGRPKSIQAVNFQDRKKTYDNDGYPISMPLEFTVSEERIAEWLKTFEEGTQVRILANAVSNYLDWYYLKDTYTDSIREYELYDDNGEVIRIPEGIFEGMTRRYVRLVNDMEDPPRFSYYGTALHEGGHDAKGWQPLPNYWRQPALKFVNQYSQIMDMPIGYCAIVRGATGTWAEHNEKIVLRYETGTSGVIFIEPVEGDTIINLHCPVTTSKDNADAKIYCYYNEDGITSWKELFGNVEPPVVDGDKHYTHTQSVLSAEWHVYHNLGKIPSTNCVSSLGNPQHGVPEFVDLNYLIYRFLTPIKGKLYCN